MAGYALVIAEKIAMEARKEMAEELKKEIRNSIPQFIAIDESIDRVRNRLDERGRRLFED